MDNDGPFTANIWWRGLMLTIPSPFSLSSLYLTGQSEEIRANCHCDLPALRSVIL